MIAPILARVIARPVSFGYAQDMVWAEAISPARQETASSPKPLLAVTRVSLHLHPIRVSPPMYGRSTSGTVIEPSAC